MPEDNASTAPAASKRQGGPDPNESRMSFGDHLDQLRSTLIKAILGWVLATIVCLLFGKDVLGLIFRPLLIAQQVNEIAPNLQVLSPMSGFTSYLKIAFITGLIVSMPWVLHQTWSFVAPGLYPHEQRAMKRLVPLSSGLFVIGVVFLYFIVLPIVLHFFIVFNKSFDVPEFAGRSYIAELLSKEPAEEPDSPEGADPPTGLIEAGLVVPVLEADPERPARGQVWFNKTQRQLKIHTPAGIMVGVFEREEGKSALRSQFAIDQYISFVLMLALGFGLAFQMPIVVYFLARADIVPLEVMVKGRRYVLLGIVIFAAVLTPPDVISQLLLAGPMYALFELGLVAARRKAKTQPDT